MYPLVCKKKLSLQTKGHIAFYVKNGEKPKPG